MGGGGGSDGKRSKGKKGKKRKNAAKGEIGEETDGQLSTTAANRSETIFLGWIIIERMIISK
jgi:hypothetical protein